MYPFLKFAMQILATKYLFCVILERIFVKKIGLKSLFCYNTINKLIIFLQKLLYFFAIIWYNYYMILRGLLC